MSDGNQRHAKETPTEHTGKNLFPSQKATPQLTKRFKPLLMLSVIGAMIVLLGGLVVFLTRSPEESVMTVTGKVFSVSGELIDGAFILAADDAVQTMPDGSFTIQATKNETLSVSAFGYEGTTVSATSPEVRLNPLPTTLVRVAVINENNLAVPHALVVRLDPNTSKPISEAVTDQSGSAIFPEVPADQALFVVMHPQDGIGWVELALTAGEVFRPVVRLTRAEGSVQSLSQGLVKKAYAQEEDDPEQIRDILERELELEKAKLVYETLRDEDKFIEPPELSVEDLGDNRFRVHEKTKTVIDMYYHPIPVESYIRIIENNAQNANIELSPESRKLINDLRRQQNIAAPVSSTRITFFPSQIKYDYDGEFEALTVDETKVFEIELPRPADGGTLAVIEREHATLVSTSDTKPMTFPSLNTRPVVVTGWAEAEMAQLVGAKYVYAGGSPNGDPPHMTVCCNRPKAEGGVSGTVPEMTTSTDVEPNGFSFSDFERKSRFYFEPVLRESPPDWQAIDDLMARNPGLEFTDKLGQKFSLYDIVLPDPQDAPGEFLHDYFESPGDALDAFNHNPARYQTIWEGYLINTATSLFQNQGIPPSEFKDLLTNMIAANKQRRFDPLGFEGGTGAASSIGQAVEDAAGSESQPPETDAGDDGGQTQDTTPTEGDSQTSGGAGQQTPPTNAGCPEGSSFTCSR